jgi:hypothetical protein
MTDVTFGDITAHGSAGTFAVGYEWATKYTLTGSDPTAVLKDISGYLETVGGHTNYIAAVWRDVAGSPGALVGYGTITIPAGAQPLGFYSVLGTGGAITLVDAGGVMDDGNYWIGYFQESTLAPNYYFIGGTIDYHSAGGTLPLNPFGSVDGTAAQNLVINATVTFSASCSPPDNAGGSALPVISGTSTEGSTLTVDSDGFWTGDPTIVFTYQWQRDCASGFLNIVGETGSTYVVTSDDVDCDLRVMVTGTSSCAPPGQAGSNIITINGPPVNLDPPTIVGVPLPGHSLLVDFDGNWTGSPTSFDYEWFADDGGGYVSTGNTTNTILLVDADIGSFFKCQVTANN